MLAAGILRQRIELQARTDAVNAYGETVPSWATYATVWAAVQPIGVREMLIAQQINSQVTHHVRIRYKQNIRPTQRIKWGRRYFDINGVRDVNESHVELVLDCVENPIPAGKAYGDGIYGDGFYGN